MIPASIGNRLWQIGCLYPYRQFASALDDPQSTQSQLLTRLLQRNAATRFGTRHKFDQIQNIAEYQNAVPLSEYSDYLAHIESIAHGTPSVLTSDRVTHFVPTSGSTTARKLIPWSSSLQGDFNRAIGPWIADLFYEIPDLRNGPAYWSVSPAIVHENLPGSSIPVGFEDDTNYLGGLTQYAVQNLMAVPSHVRHITDIETFRRQVLTHLLTTPELRLISVWHPSFFSILLDDLARHFDLIIRSLHSQRKHRSRARELESIDPGQPEKIWPKLRLISAWGNHDSPDVRNLMRHFPNTRFQSKGLLATEAVVTIPFGNQHPLAVTSHFFEFLDTSGRCLLAHQLETGKRYEVIVTTSGGLYRYRLRDLVDVTGFVGHTPSLNFIGRSGHVSDMRGEKLDEAFVAPIIDRLLLPFAESIRFRQLIAAHETPGYLLFLTHDSSIDHPSIANDLETCLRTNPHYQLCRHLGQLEPVKVVRVGNDAIHAYFQWNQSHGRTLGETKPHLLLSEPGLAAWLNQHAIAD